MALTAEQKLEKLKQKSIARKPAATTAKKTKGMRKISFNGTPYENDFVELCELATIIAEIEPAVNEHKSLMRHECFNLWTQELWETRKKPDNFKAFLKKRDKDGKVIDLEDMCFNFVLKFRTTGVKNKVDVEADEDGMPKETIQEAVQRVLASEVVGLSEENAANFVEEEVEILEKTELFKPLNEMLESSDPLIKSIGVKIRDYIIAEPKNKRQKNGTVALLNDQERAMALDTTQTVSLKKGLLERIVTYCDSLEELRDLLNWIEVTKEVSKFEIGLSDNPAERSYRLQGAVEQYLIYDEDK